MNINSNQNDLKVDQQLCPTDSVSCLVWLNNRTIGVSSWDGDLRILEVVAEQNSIQLRRQVQLVDSPPILTIAFKDDGSKVFMGLGDGRLQAYDVQSQQVLQLAQHQQAICSIHYVPQIQMLVVADYDMKLVFYNPNLITTAPQQQLAPVMTFTLDSKVHALDIKYPLLVAGLSKNKVLLLEMTKMQFIQNNHIGSNYYIDCILMSNISCVSIFNDLSAYCVGTYDGRANISKIQRDNVGNIKNGDSVICFKCQKFDSPQPNSQILVPVNSIIGNIRGKNNCVTVGSDGIINIWDYINKNKTIQMNFNIPVTKCAVSPDGFFLFYALGYDWHAGIVGFDPSVQRPQLFLHYIKEEELQSKKT